MRTKLHLFLIWVVSGIGACVATPTELPQYHFKVGQQLSFRYHKEQKFQYGVFIQDGTTTIWIVSELAPGSWRAIARILNTESELDKSGKVLDAGDPSHPEATWIRANVSANGVTDHVESEENDEFPTLIVLPKSTYEMAHGWKYLDPVSQSTESYSATPGTTDLLQIHRVENSVSDDIYLKKESCDITFDCANSVPVHLQLTTSQGYGLIGTSTGSVDFTAVSMCDPTLLNQLDQDFTKYFKLLNEFDLLDRVGSADVENEINKLKAKITAEQATIQSPEFVKLFDQMLASLSNKATLGEYKQLAQAREKLLSEPVKDWKTTDLDGKTHSLSDFKGNVVVLDFWYRGCGWCILAMPQIEAVAEHYANRPVTVIGMCTNNPDSGDGLFVAKKMGLTYPVYNAKEIATSYHIQGFPTTVIIDQTGAIRDVETGWKSDLRDTLLQKIDALLH